VSASTKSSSKGKFLGLGNYPKDLFRLSGREFLQTEMLLRTEGITHRLMQLDHVVLEIAAQANEDLDRQGEPPEKVDTLI
jgi:hypothetical protein